MALCPPLSATPPFKSLQHHTVRYARCTRTLQTVDNVIACRVVEVLSVDPRFPRMGFRPEFKIRLEWRFRADQRFPFSRGIQNYRSTYTRYTVVYYRSTDTTVADLYVHNPPPSPVNGPRQYVTVFSSRARILVYTAVTAFRFCGPYAAIGRSRKVQSSGRVR